jgi:hypothetical protein
MARKAEAILWMLVKIGERSVMKRLVKKGRSYVPKVKGLGKTSEFGRK